MIGSFLLCSPSSLLGKDLVLYAILAKPTTSHFNGGGCKREIPKFIGRENDFD